MSDSVASAMQSWFALQRGLDSNRKYFYFDSIDSTNTYLKNTAYKRAVCAASTQTAGRGRGSNLWTAAPASGLLCSWSYRLSCSIQPQLTLKIGLTALKAIETGLQEAQIETPAHVRFALKAPNDIHAITHSDLSGESDSTFKLAGILTEAVSHTPQETTLVIGIGLNLTDAPKNTEPFAAISLKDLGIAVSEPLVHSLLKNLTAAFDQLLESLVALKQTALSTQDCTELKDRLTQHPMFKTLLEVSPKGDLVFPEKVILWSSL